MSVFPSAFVPFGQQAISLDRGFIESVVGGITWQWDVADSDVSSYEVQFGPLTSLQKFYLTFLLGDMTEETTIFLDGITYVGVFSSVFTTEKQGTVYVVKAQFIGVEQ